MPEPPAPGCWPRLPDDPRTQEFELGWVADREPDVSSDEEQRGWPWNG